VKFLGVYAGSLDLFRIRELAQESWEHFDASHHYPRLLTPLVMRSLMMEVDELYV
jgi:hypothetical protein